MFKIISHQGNSNQNHTEIPPYASYNGKNRQGKKQQLLERMWRKGIPPTLLVECKLVEPLWKTVWRSLKKLKFQLPYDPAIALLGIYPKGIDEVK